MMDEATARESAKAFRRTHILNVCLGAAGGETAPLAEACDTAEQAIAALVLATWNEAVEVVRARVNELDAEPHCVNGHDFCYQGADDNCPYCEKYSNLDKPIRALRVPVP